MESLATVFLKLVGHRCTAPTGDMYTFEHVACHMLGQRPSNRWCCMETYAGHLKGKHTPTCW